MAGSYEMHIAAGIFETVLPPQKFMRAHSERRRYWGRIYDAATIARARLTGCKCLPTLATQPLTYYDAPVQRLIQQA